MTDIRQNLPVETGVWPWRRILVGFCLLALASAPGGLGELTRRLMADAYLQVSVFVAATLMIFYFAERVFHFDLGEAMGRSKFWQVPIAAFLGVTPGCGGAVVVVAAYASGKVSFGAVVATLTATMGDAAFLLIATKPEAAMVLLPVQFSVGILSGWLIDRFVTTDYRPSGRSCHATPLIGALRLRDMAYALPFVPGLMIGLGLAATADVQVFLGVPVIVIALVGVAISIGIWVFSPVVAMTNQKDAPLTRVAEETSFITIWVIAAYLAYDYLAAYAGLNLQGLFSTIGPALPLLGAMVGLIPGCGPQIVVTTLYLNGIVPFSALVANAISNDGDALFPAIALAPRAAIMATVWSLIPALLVSYGFYFLAPDLMN